MIGLTTAADMQLLKGVKGCMLCFEWYMSQRIWNRKLCEMTRREKGGCTDNTDLGITEHNLCGLAASKTADCRHYLRSLQGR